MLESAMASARAESREDLIRHFEELTGRAFRTREDVRAYIDEVAAAQEALHARLAGRWRTAKSVALMIGASLAFLQYQMVDTLHQIVSLKGVQVFLPAQGWKASGNAQAAPDSRRRPA